ncbi:hypothetical protein [Bradyrhizobium sp. CCGUVB14]|uniref:hypothetical protein n=1 Tax=Bradyrhizobium sp. CCGUVB14 TaxID=2949628 RepID=UPI0020B40164|nr:hypothetical protein [Bradyrhizobium sp. CCGUVB14]MCP3444198.1 hypothetical protein [Bradyrhizobium sp. CCGUVB14]
MSPSKYEVTKANIEKRCDAARKAGDIAELQRCAADLTALNHAYYGRPEKS